MLVVNPEIAALVAVPKTAVSRGMGDTIRVTMNDHPPSCARRPSGIHGAGARARADASPTGVFTA